MQLYMNASPENMCGQWTGMLGQNGVLHLMSPPSAHLSAYSQLKVIEGKVMVVTCCRLWNVIHFCSWLCMVNGKGEVRTSRW